MTKHTCKHCNRIFEYCRGCLLSPIPHMDAGFCSKECYEASKINIVPVVEPEIIEAPVVVEEPKQVVEDVQPIEEEVAVEVVDETEAIASVEAAEAVVAVETAPKKETNTYKKKKNKYEYTSSL